MAHDFNNLLAVILSYSAFVDEELTEVAGVRLMNRDTLAQATRPRTDDHTVTSSNSDHPSNITNWAQCTRAREDDRRINGDRNCETASALSAFDKRKLGFGRDGWYSYDQHRF